MIDLDSILSQNRDDIDAVTDWCNDLYTTNFGQYFTESRELFKRLQSNKNHPITDEELSYILINIPLTLFDVSEQLNKLKTTQEVIKLKNKQKESDLVKSSTENSNTKRQEEASLKMVSDKILVTAFATVTSRVENEISFCRELIMGAKKIWDARRRTEQSNPVSEIEEPTATNLPVYKFRKE